MSKSLNLPYLNILVAYPYMTKGMILALQKAKDATEGRFRFLLDSGAFTAYNSGKEIKLDDYCRFIESLPFEPTGYFMLDVIGNPSATMKNYEIMLKRGFNPIPVFTRGEDFSVLEEFYRTSDYVALGGLVGGKKNKKLYFIQKSLKIANNRKMHLLGFTSYKYVRRFKPYSVDSSSWTSGTRFGSVSIFKRNKGICTYSGIRKQLHSKPPIDIIKAYKELGYGYKDIAKKENWSGGALVLSKIGALAYMKLFLAFERYSNTKGYFACSSQDNLGVLASLYKERIINGKNRFDTI